VSSFVVDKFENRRRLQPIHKGEDQDREAGQRSLSGDNSLQVKTGHDRMAGGAAYIGSAERIFCID
jgi:hypothetical protein